MFIEEKEPIPDPMYEGKNIREVIEGNLFDGQVSYTHKGYNNGNIKVRN